MRTIERAMPGSSPPAQVTRRSIMRMPGVWPTVLQNVTK